MQRVLLAGPSAAALPLLPSSTRPRRSPTMFPPLLRERTVSAAAAAAAPVLPRRLGGVPDDDSSPLATAVEPPSPREAETEAEASSSSSPTPPPPKDEDDNEPPSSRAPPPPRPKGSSFYANVGTAVRTIRDDLPALFQRDMDFSIYRDDVVFRDPRNAFHGIDNYRTIFWSVRFHGNLFFRDLRVDVSRVWQPEPREIRVRWSARGVSRLPWRPVGVFDGISTFKLDEEGMIYVHEVNNVVLRPPPGARNALSPLFARLNLVPEGLEGGLVPGVPTGGGGACPGWRGAEAGRARAAPLSFEEVQEVEEVESGSEWRRRENLASSLPSFSSSTAAAAADDESVLVLSQETSYSYLTSLGLWTRRSREEGRQGAARKRDEEEKVPSAASFFVGA